MTAVKAPNKRPSLPPRERILAVAEDLFYREGYRATGIDKIILESAVAKATFYAHFPSKDALCLAYLRRMGERELGVFEQQLAALKDPKEKFMLLMRHLDPWLAETHFRGCAFLNMVSEAPDPTSPLREEGRRIYRRYEQIQRDLARQIIAAEPQKYAGTNAAQMAKRYITIMAGAIALAEIHHDLQPIRDAVRMAEELLR